MELNQTDFARHAGWSRSYVSKLKGQGRLVMSPSGLIDVHATLEKIAATGGVTPAARGQEQRWDDYRANQGKARPDSQPDNAGLTFGVGDDVRVKVGDATKLQALRKLKADADRAEMERDTMRGRLIERDTVQADMRTAAGVILNALEGHPDRLAPLLLNQTDLATVRALLRDEVESIQSTIAHELGQIARHTEEPA